MRFIKFNNERKLADLVRRAYRIEGRGAAELIKRAEAALLKANPSLGNLRELGRGTLVMVPEVPGLRLTDEVETTATATSDLITQAQASLEVMEKSVATTLSRTIEEAQATTKLAKSRQFRALVEKQVPPAVKLLDEIPGTAKKSAAQAKAVLKSYSDAFQQARKDLESLTKKLS